MNLFFTFELAKRLDGSNITVNGVHPGPIRSSFGRSKNNPWWYRFGYSMAMPFLKSTKKGAATSVHIASSIEGGEITEKWQSQLHYKSDFCFHCRSEAISLGKRSSAK